MLKFSSAFQSDIGNTRRKFSQRKKKKNFMSCKALVPWIDVDDMCSLILISLFYSILRNSFNCSKKKKEPWSMRWWQSSLLCAGTSA